MSQVPPSILSRWQITETELTALVAANPSLRGILFGYVAELHFRKLFEANPHVTSPHKEDDHNRTKKGDLIVTYKGHQFVLESKSLQTNSIRRDGTVFRGKAQVDASDRRKLTLPNGRRVETTCLLVGEFDILGVNVYAFEDRWRFVFALNRDLPRTGFRKYSPYQRKHLLATLVDVSWPPEPPFVEDPFVLLDRVVKERSKQ